MEKTRKNRTTQKGKKKQEIKHRRREGKKGRLNFVVKNEYRNF